MTPIVMRLEGAVRAQPARGSMAAAPAALRKSRRLMPASGLELGDCDFISFSQARFAEVLNSIGSVPKIEASFDTSLYIRRDSFACNRYCASRK
jgi:hypothetical protein